MVLSILMAKIIMHSEIRTTRIASDAVEASVVDAEVTRSPKHVWKRRFVWL